MTDDDATPARSFGPVAEAYDRARPSYPAAAAAWLMNGSARTVVELGAGTGKLTSVLAELGHDVHATDPDPEMLRLLRERCPQVRASIAPAESIPAPDRSVDVVVAAQSFHWFDAEAVLPEISRVLKPGGHLALVWNERDDRIPWVRRLGGLLGHLGHDTSADPVVQSELFGFVEEERFPHWQQIDRVSILDLARSRSNVATLDPEEREAKLAEVAAFYADYGRGMDGMQLPYLAHCYRAKATDVRPPPRRSGAGDPDAAGDGGSGEGPTPPPADGETGEFLLIDFR